MRPDLIIVALLIFFSCSKKDVNPSVQLFANTDMEAGTTYPANWWYNENGTAASFSWTQQVSHSGTRSLGIESPTDLPNAAYWGQSVTQGIPVGGNLTLQVRIKGNVTDGSAAAAIACLNATSNTQAQQFSTTEGTHVISGNFDWTSYTVKLDGVHSDIKEIRVYLMLLSKSKGAVYFDDVTLTAN